MALTPEQLKALEERKALGNAGKLFSIECYCKSGINLQGKTTGAEMRRHMLKNQTSAELMRFRADVFAVGIMLPLALPKGAENMEPMEWEIIHPQDIISLIVTRQSKYFQE